MSNQPQWDSEHYIQCICTFSSCDRPRLKPQTDFAVVKKIGSKTYYLIDAWRHAHDVYENRIDDLTKDQRCQIQEWYLELTHKQARTLLAPTCL